jgi:hypothetical protein
MIEEPQLYNSLVHPIQKRDDICYFKKEKEQTIAINRPSGKAPKHKRHHAISQ